MEERILYRTKLHWVCYSIPLFLFVIPGAIGFFSAKALSDKLITFMIVAVGVYICLEIYYVEIILTDKKVISKSNFIRKDSTEIFLDKIESVKVDQGLIGRLLGFGKIEIVGIGGTKESFGWVTDPQTFRGKIADAITKFRYPKFGGRSY